MSRSILTSCLFALLAAGCGASVQSTIPRPTDLSDGRPVQTLFDEDTSSLAWMDLGAVRRSELYEEIGADVDAWTAALEEMADELDAEEAEGEEAADLLDSFGATEWILIASSAPESADADGESVTLIGGSLTDAQVRALVKAEAEDLLEAAEGLPLDADPSRLLGGGLGGGLGSGLGEDATEEEAPEVEVHKTHEEGRLVFVADEVIGTEVTTGVWILGTRARVQTVLARIGGASPPTTRIRTHALDEAIDPLAHQVAFTVTNLDQGRSDAFLEALRDDAEGEPFAPGWWSDVEGVGFALDLGTGLEATAILQAEDERAAGIIRTESERMLEEAIDEGTLAVMGLPRLLDRIEAARDGSRVRFTLSLDRAQAHLWWGKLSGAVGAALVVVELITGFFQGIGEALEEPGELEDDPPPGGIIEGTVSGVDAGAPVAQGTPCTARIVPGEAQGFGWTCHATVECGGKVLYGGPGAGWFQCTLGTAGAWFVSGTDTQPTGADGDATFHVDTLQDRMEVSDDAQGTFGSFHVEIEVQSTTPEPTVP